ncbi:trypsin-like peptidase domain-containing protein [Bradyrhizobium sp.]|uniref:S1C family serine protease n=1 Tax=Bradyrhizobium sp. TaxID=376 RepID=UPI001ED2585C|nr:trypsin-like peptidase domain-containing protein [Bradyrhizobium sp.]MBV9979217.1 trypsin-like peptidase domain-containing protein [Bradyrhizobium sp.]
MIRAFLVACVVQVAITTAAGAAGPYGMIRVGNWMGGAYTNDTNGTFSHCAAGSDYESGVSLIVSQTTTGSWLLGFASQRFSFKQGDALPIDVMFDGQSQARLFANANTSVMVSAILPPNVARTFQKASLMVAVAGGTPYQFNLTSTGPLLAAIANCVTRVKLDGIEKAGDFTVPKAIAAKSASPADAPGGSRSSKAVSKTGTGFVISPSGHIVTNQHVIAGCSGDIRGNLTGEPVMTLRTVSSDESNDLALLQAPASASFKDFARIRDRTIRSGDSVVAIGFPYHGLLTSDFTVTTGIVSSLSGILNDSRFLQISAAVQPGNSGGPLLDSNGLIVGMVAAKIDAMRFVRATGNIPENINFAIKTGAIRDFLDNSVVPYETGAGKGDLKTPEIAGAARAYTMLISCTATEQAESAKR